MDHGGNASSSSGGSSPADSKASSPAAASFNEPEEQKTFWTNCHDCRMRFEYPRVYLNRNLRCVACREAFRAVEIAPPRTNGLPYCRNDAIAASEVIDDENGNEREGEHSPLYSRSSVATSNAESAVTTHHVDKVVKEKPSGENEV